MRRSRLAAAVVIPLLVLAAACTGGLGGTDAASSGDAETVSRDDHGGGVTGGGRADGDASGGAPEGRGVAGAPPVDGVNRTVFEVRSVIRTGSVSVTSDDVDAARSEAQRLVDSWGGAVENEETAHDQKGRISHSTLVLRVPVGKFADAMTALEDLGRVQHSDTSSEDVTTEVIDVAERVETLQNSLDRLQSYQSRAADIEDLLRYEQQITQREAELQSLKAQQSYLADQTAMSTITLSLSRREAFVPPPDTLDDAGFLAGLESGWNALRGTVVVVLTVVGAVLPFGVVLALLGVPAWVLVRRLLRRPAAAPAPAGAGEPGPSAG